MRFDVITLFPDLFAPHLAQGVTRRAFEGGQVDVRLWPLRDFATDAYRRVDDRPFGGGPGMVMLGEPLLAALARVHQDRAAAVSAPAPAPAPAPGAALGVSPAGAPGAALGADAAAVPVVHFTPTGRPLTQALVREFAAGAGAVLICGRYEGVDQRVIDAEVTLEISVGDYVLSGGELPALLLLDAVARLQPGVLSDASHQQDSFSDGLLEGPAYTRPEQLAVEGRPVGVPAVLLSGDHGRIRQWRREQALALTARRRPELLEAARAAGQLSPLDERYLRQLGL